MKTPRITGCIQHSMIDVPVSQIILNQTGIQSLISKSITTGVTQHVRMNLNSQPRTLTISCSDFINPLPGDFFHGLTEKDNHPDYL